MNARHRVSKMLLRHGRVYPKDNTWSREHRRWLSRQQFEQEISAFVFADLVARVDGLTPAKQCSLSGSRGWRSTRSTGRPSRGCGRFGASTR